MSTNVTLCSILNLNKLTDPNYLDWYHNLRIVLKAENILYVLDTSGPLVSLDDVTVDQQQAYLKYSEDNDMATCIMLASMSPELQKQHQYIDAYTIIFHLKELFEEQARIEQYEISKLLFQDGGGNFNRISCAEDVGLY
ncbi:hypothetical protein Cni_G12689 [Canna indica]|uniref:Retrotransposon Copia-like N-terminal domain-containing protein n=1 Tax=Canna indica TaxID=4628 RepID=A0AAQ3K8M6_9LILI|nr:hypothetical protein Cni_G12689 [Canna indica]